MRMCLSPEVDLAAGVIVTAIGVDSIRQTTTRRELPLASLPLLFGAHQLIEVLVWWGAAGKVSTTVSEVARYLYLAIAFALPVIVPLAVRAVEPVPRARAAMTACAGIGAFASLILLGALIGGPVEAAAADHHIAYTLSIPGGAAASVLYVVATCGALLVASDRWIRAFGVLNLFAVLVLMGMTVEGFASLWCLWAALTSVAINRYLREERGSEAFVTASS